MSRTERRLIMAKATHTGECQICGNTQKLPSGRLSQHGYTVDNGWFNGICQGARELPFEQSKDLIAGVVENVKLQIESVKRTIKKIEDNLHNTKNVRLRVYCDKTYKYKTIRVDLIIRKNKHGHEEYFGVTDKGEEHKISHYGSGGIEAVAENLWKYEVKDRESQVNSMERYVEWQNERMANWKPKELTAVEA